MPSQVNDDGTPIVYFNAQLEISPFTLFRRMQQGSALLLVDVRSRPDNRTLHGAVPGSEPDWTPAEKDLDVVLFDDDGSEAVAVAERLQQAGFSRARALFGGLDLYEFSLDPEVLQTNTFLESGSTRSGRD